MANTRRTLVWLIIGTLTVSALAQQPDLATPGAIATPNAAANITQFRDEGRIPASFRKVPQGLEVAVLHADLPRMRLTNRRDPNVLGFLDVGDILARADGRPLDSVATLFGLLRRGPVPINLALVNVQNGNMEEWIADPISVRVPLSPTRVQADGSGRVIVIHAVDTADSAIGVKIAQNIDSMQALFEEHVAAERRADYIILRDQQCTAIGIIETLAQVQVRPQDTLFLYYQGHGAYDPNLANQDPAAGHFFDFAREDLRRSSLLKAMQTKGARLTVLVSDACNRRSTLEVIPKQAYALKQMQVTGWTGLEELLFCYRGTLDLTAASRGQYSWCTKDVGSWFTYSMIASLSDSTAAPQRSWTKLWAQVKQRTESLYAQRRDKFMGLSPALKAQTTLIPQEFIWEIERNDPPQPPQGLRVVRAIASSFVN